MGKLPKSLNDILNRTGIEDDRVEFKASWNDATKGSIVRTVCAFANDFYNMNGGYIVIGIEQNSEGEAVLPPKGIQGVDLDTAQKEITGACRAIEPDYLPLVFIERFQGELILVIWAPAGDNRPYQAPIRGRNKGKDYHIRIGAQTIQARGEHKRQLLELAAKTPFDDRVNPHASVKDLSPLYVRKYIDDVKSELARESSDMEILRSLRLVKKINDHEAPRNVALLFFSEDPEKYFPGARIEIAHFADDAGGDLIDEKTIRGPIDFQARQSISILNSLVDVHLHKNQNIMQVEKTVTYPFQAMEEAVVNALLHRSYDATYEPVKIYLYPDRMEIISYPGPVPGIKREDLHSERPVPPVKQRNRRIGDFFKEIKLAEMRSTGIPKIHRAMRENGSPKPEFDFDDERSFFRVILPAHPQYFIIDAIREAAKSWVVGETNNAIEKLENVRKTHPHSGALVSQLIDYHSASGDINKAVSLYEDFKNTENKTEPHRPSITMAQVLLDHGKKNEANRILKEIDTSEVNTQFEMALLRKRARDFRTAHKIFSRIRSHYSNDPKFLHEFAQTKLRIAGERKISSYERKEFNREAADLIRRAIQLSDDSVRLGWCWNDLAQALYYLRRPVSEIEDAYRQAMKYLPNDNNIERNFKKWKDQARKRNPGY